jgi:hypothetical protein
MNCAEFQKVLPYIIESGGSAAEEAHLKSCPVCADLVQDLRYIAEQAKLLLPMHEPSPRVWQSIQRSLGQEGLVRRQERLAPVTTSYNPLRWRPLAQVSAIAAALVMALALFAPWNRPATAPESNASTTESVPPMAAPDPDQQLLASISERMPAARETYATNLKAVNQYISEAKKSVEERPEDEAARQHLMRAYEQKNMLYEMALSQSMY